MVTVDAKGRVVLPQGVRKRLGITPGTEVEIRADDGRAVVEPEEDPERIIEDLTGLVEAASKSCTSPPPDSKDPEARRHVEAVRRRADSE